MAKRREVVCEAPFLKRTWLERSRVERYDEYPFSLPIFKNIDFDLKFEDPITILVGENGSGKSTILEAIARMAGYDEAGGGKGYRAVDHSHSIETMGGGLSVALKASWWPKITQGWFFRAESFFSVARYLDQAALDVNAPPPDFLSHSHGEGFLRFFEERTRRRGIFIFDEPESALSPARQIDFMKTLMRMRSSKASQVIMATHSPLIMAIPGAQLLEVSNHSISPVSLENVIHFRILKQFYTDPNAFLERNL
jgi:predicted ATPase